MFKISVAIITLNEELNIERCLKSVQGFADEIIVLDSGSVDKTLEIARQYTGQIHFRKWTGFRDQKQAATELCQNDWVLSLDADEVLTEELKLEIKQFFETNTNQSYEAVQIPRLSHYLGEWIWHGGWYPDYQTKLFQKSKCQWSGGAVHEYIEAKTIYKFKNHLLHYVFKNVSHHITTNNKYSTQGAIDLAQKNKKFSILKLIFKPLGKFIECYIIKRGFQDGLPGFIIAISAAYSMFLKYTKLKYLNQETKN